MKNWSIRTTLIIFFASILIVILVLNAIIFGYLRNAIRVNDLIKTYYSFNLKYKDYIQSQYDFLVNYQNDPIFFRTEQNEYIRRQQILYNELKNDIQPFFENPFINQNEIEKLSQIKTQLELIDGYFNDLKHKLYIRGNLGLKSGYIGKVQEYYEVLKANSPNRQFTDLVEQIHNDFLAYVSSADETYYKSFLSHYTQINRLIQGLEPLNNPQIDTSVVTNTTATYSNLIVQAVNEYKNYFRSLIELDNELGLSGNKGVISAWADVVNSTTGVFNVIKEDLVTYSGGFLTKELRTFIIFFTIIFILLLGIFWFNLRLFRRSYQRVYQYIQPLRYGQLPEIIDIDIKIHDEIGEVLNVLNIYIGALHKTVEFAQELGKGRFDVEFQPLSEKDMLGNALLQLREDLRRAQEEEEKRKEEERIRQWTNEGISKFAELLRQKADKISDLARVVIKNLVNYLNANQGAFFYLNDENPDDVFLELIATYAYNRERRKQKKFKLGEGLVGTVALEKATTYMTDIPEDYVSITSGLGGATPRSLLIVPLKYEEEVVGVVEIASFNEMKDYEINFVEQVAESIAATLSLTKINERTARLLEMSQLQAREMAAKEEEMRQNLEELKATQEEAARREAQLQSLLNAIESAGFVTVLDLNGFIVRVNERLLDYLGVLRDDLVGHHISEFDLDGHTAKDDFLERIISGETVHILRNFEINGQMYWFDEYYSPIRDARGNVIQIIVISTDITENVKKAQELEQKAMELEERESKLKLEMAELTEARDQLQKQRDKAEKELKELAQKQAALNRALEVARKREKESDELIKDLLRQKEELQDKYEDFLANKEIVEYMYRKIEKQEDSVFKELAEAKKLLAEKDKRIKELEEELEKCRKDSDKRKGKK